MARRLPIYFVIDCSVSMVGKPITDVERALSAVVGALRSDPHALETAHIGVIAFAEIGKVLVRLTGLMDFQAPTLPIGAGTNLGAGLEVLMAEIDASIIRGSPDRKGDWKPVVYLMSDGRPTGDAKQAIQKWQQNFARRANVVGIGFGADADLSVLRQVALSAQGVANVFSYDPSRDADMKSFVRWISQSISTQSASLSGDRLVLASLEGDAFRPAEEVAATVGDDRWVPVVARCGVKGTPFIAKYVAAGTPGNAGRVHALEGMYPVAESYFEWSGPEGGRSRISTDMFGRWDTCPVCRQADRALYAVCSCGRVFCDTGRAGRKTCPWCKLTGDYGEPDGPLDIAQGRA